MAATKNRPIAPHLQVWRWGPAMLVSILHRVSGDGLALVGLGVLIWWLASLAGGPEAYAGFVAHASAWYGKVVLVGLTWAFFNHMASGIRHFVLDIGAGYELKNNAAWSVATPLLALAATVATWAVILLK
ncbi:succinate dehydrogenase, cytochrome b556 subunit [Novosphingobium sp. NPDC080210]|jgi:succinate dehydrogenase / fumarate reductase cytochrome b subunit|uniref:succinate dehydrogenase, cytochrome b556 subunit n=1 Tax=unclassified Novosphingobium TaxID=2644732 RepID=UPI00323ABC4E